MIKSMGKTPPWLVTAPPKIWKDKKRKLRLSAKGSDSLSTPAAEGTKSDALEDEFLNQEQLLPKTLHTTASHPVSVRMRGFPTER